MNATKDAKVPDLGKLSRREREVFNYLVMDLRHEQIGRRLFLSRKTIAVHQHNICEKLGLTSRVGIVLLAVELGLIERPVAA
jgi:two-component system nitrate/nitrite response regulator NarL